MEILLDFHGIMLQWHLAITFLKKLTLVDPIIGVSIFLQFISLNNLTDQKFAKTTVLNGGITTNRFQILKNMGITFGFFLNTVRG